MTDDNRVLRLLTEVLDELPTTAPDRLLGWVLDSVGTAPQRGRWSFLPRIRDVVAEPSVRRLAAGGLLVAVVAGFAFLQLSPRSGTSGLGATSSPSPAESSPTIAPPASPSPSATAPPSASEGTPVALEDIAARSLGTLQAGVTYTSNRFEPRVTFKLSKDGYTQESGGVTDWCSPPQTSARTIVLAFRHACVSDLRLIHPYSVDCGTANAHPDAATLAAAILAKPSMTNVHDLGTLQSAAVIPANLFLSTYQGRVIELDEGRAFDSDATDPDRCRLLPEPGSQDPTIEIRGDTAALLILIDLHGELVVVRTADLGYDAATGAADRAQRLPSYLPYRLLGIYEIEFK